MTLRQIEYFCAIAEAKSISAAARALYVEQPPISRQIAALENELGVQLYIRGSRGIVLTEAGQRLYDQCSTLLTSIENIKENVKAVGAGIKGTIKVGLIYSTIPYAIPYIRRYHDIYPHVKLHVRMGTPQDLIIALTKGELNVLFLRDNASLQKELSSRILGEDDMALIMTESLDPMPDADAIPIACLKDVPMCFLGDNDIWSYNASLLNECRKHGFEPTMACTCYDTPMAMQMIQNGFGLCFLPASIVRTQPNSGIYAKPVKDFHPKSYVKIAWRNDYFISNCVTLFVNN